MSAQKAARPLGKDAISNHRRVRQVQPDRAGGILKGMAHVVCAKCSKPILAIEDTSTVDQVDACTMAVERVTYHSNCKDREPDEANTHRQAPESPTR